MSPNKILRSTAALLALLGAGCTLPAESSFVEASGRATSGQPVGPDARGESCFVQTGVAGAADLPIATAREVFCGGWTQPSARLIQTRGSNDPAQLDALARGGVWRSALEQRVACGDPQATTTANGAAVRILSCTRRQGGWPHTALVIAGAGGPILADGIDTAMPVVERLAAGQAGQGAGTQPRSALLEIATRRLAAQSFSGNDIGQYERLMAAGRDLNQTESFAAAEDAYRAALSLQERILGRDNPDNVTALVHLALNVANQGRRREAETLFARSERLAPLATDPVAVPRLNHYRGLAAMSERAPARAIEFLRRAEEGYGVLIPSSTLRGTTDFSAFTDPVTQSAILGWSEARRNLALVLAREGDVRRSAVALGESRDILRRAGIEPGLMTARSLRSEGAIAAAAGNIESSARLLEAAARRFAIAAPGERPEATTLFLAGARRLETGNRMAALTAFRAGHDILKARQISLPVNLVLPYLDALDAEARANPARADALRLEMFAAAQLAQRSEAVRFVQQASARLAVASGDARISEAVRRLQDADEALRGLFAQRDAGEGDGLDQKIAEAQAVRAEAESAVAVAAPGYRQLVMSATSAGDVAAALAANEAMVLTLLGRNHGFVLAVRQGKVFAARTGLGENAARQLVDALRAGVFDPATGAEGRFDPVPARRLYAELLGPLQAALDGVQTLVVVPDGPLLAIPFGMLLTADAASGPMASYPWLIRRHAVVHVPSAQAFVTLRGAGAASRAPLSYVGFGDFLPPTSAQLAASFPAERCGADAAAVASLGRLEGTLDEVRIAGQLLGARPTDLKLGRGFTAEALRGADLGQRRIIHLATHALLATELNCLNEPSILLTPQPGAADAASAFIRASDILGFKLDADLVILSACNTGGGGDNRDGGGEALSGLARSFFFAGARGLMVTHWAVNDTAAQFTIADSMRRQAQGGSSAAALRGAQLAILDEAGKRLPETWGHPFYWSPFALIGDGKRVMGASASVGAEHDQLVAAR
jgi:CHAT domain-containing protein